MDKRKRFI